MPSLIRIFQKVVSDVLSSSEKRRLLHQETKGQSNEDLHTILARNRLEQNENKELKEGTIPSLERTIAALKQENAVYREQAREALCMLERIAGVINSTHDKICK